MKPLLPALLATLSLTQLASARVTLDPERRSPLTDIPASLSILIGGGAESDITGSDYSWEQYSLRTILGPPINLTDDLRLLYGINYSLTRINQGNLPQRDQLGDLHTIALPLSAIYQKENSPWSFFAQVSGQISTDFKNVNSDDFDFTALLAGQYQFTDTFALNFGAARTLAFGESRIFPALGMVWTPTHDWAFTIIGPRMTLSHRVNDNFILRAGGFPTGGLWNVEEESGESVDYGLTSYNAGIGLDYKLRHGVWLSIWGGMTFVNELRATQDGDTLFEDDLDSGFFGSISINIYEW